jgi:hypothetical protein
MKVLCFTDHQMALLRDLAAPLRPKQRGRFLDLRRGGASGSDGSGAR